MSNIDVDIIVSGFNEDPPIYPGGIWRLSGDRISELYRGYGIFGLAQTQDQEYLLAATRVEDPPFIAFRRVGSSYRQIRIELTNYLQARRAHGIAIHSGKLYLAAAQGQVGAPMATNTDLWAGHGVSRILISRIAFSPSGVTISDTLVWDPYECDHHHHYNDLLVNETGVHVVSFTTCKPDKEYVSLGSVTRFYPELKLDRILTDALDAPHSLSIFDGRMFVCSSRNSSIFSLPLDGGAVKLEYKGIDNFVRGLHVSGRYIWMGLSRSSGRTNSAHLVDSINGVLRFDRRTGATRYIALPEYCDNTYALLAVTREEGLLQNLRNSFRPR